MWITWFDVKTIVDTQSWNWYMPLFLEENGILWVLLKGELDRIILVIFQYLDGPN